MSNEIWWESKDYLGLEFLICSIPSREKKNIIKEAQRHQGLKKRKQGIMDLIDTDLTAKLTILRAVKDCKGLKNKHLLDILDIEKKREGKWQFKGEKDKDGKFDGEFKIKFDTELLREIAECHSPEFMGHINTGLDFIDDLERKEVSEELKN